MNYLFVDTETNDIRRPRLVELAWMLTDKEGATIEEWACLIKPVDFEISEGAFNVHGISTEVALSDGMDIKPALKELAYILTEAGLMIAHGMQFDMRVLTGEFDRTNILSDIRTVERFCTMRGTTEFCKLPKTRGSGFKWPKLSELYYTLFEEDLLESHGALVDVQTTAKCFFKLKEMGVIKL